MADKPSIIDWHRIFGLALKKDFQDKPFEIKTEIDLSIKQQYLDVIILRQKKTGYVGSLPDGLDNLAQRNLISYKSLRESLDDWTLDELVGHYVNYRKQVSPKSKLLPKSQFQLYAICTRFPENLARDYVLTQRQAGVYTVSWGSHQVWLIVLSRIPIAEHNALWNLFSNVQENVEHAAEQYHSQPNDISSIINRLFEFYKLEGLYVAYTMADFHRDYLLEELPDMLQDQTIQKKFVGIMLNKLSANKLLENIPADQIEAYLQQDENITEGRKKLINTIGQMLKLRFQTEIDPYRPVLEALALTALVDLNELAATAESLAAFEAHLEEAERG